LTTISQNKPRLQEDRSGNMRIVPRSYVLDSVINEESLNFKDEISLRGVECNIPPISYRSFISRVY